MSQVSSSRVNPLPFTTLGYFVHSSRSRFLTIAALANCAQVNKAWNSIMHSSAMQSFWTAMYDAEKIPHIEGHDSEVIMKDYLFMSPRTYGARKITCLGTFIGDVPMMSATAFNKFKTENDAYEPNKKMSETWVIIVEPVKVQRPSNKALLAALLSGGDFIDSQEQSLMISYSLKNLKILAEYPLAKKGKWSALSYFYPEVLSQCNRVARTVKVTLMRKEVPEQSRNKMYADQKRCFEEHGHVIVPLSTRLCFDVIEILTNDDCPDRKKPRLTVSRTSDEVKEYGSSYPAAIGAYHPGDGGRVHRVFDSSCDGNGAAPAVSAEVPAVSHSEWPLIY